MSVLLIGADSRLSKRVIKIIEIKYLTSRKKESPYLFLDLEDTSNFIIPNDVEKCLIVGGPVSYGQSNNKKNYVKDIHLNQIPNLVKNLLERNIFTVYISSNMVLGKKSIVRNEFSLPYPNIEYGKTKFYCEKEISNIAAKLNKTKKLAILRLTKNISPDTSPFSNWIMAYQKSEIIYPFEDLFFSPVNFESSAKCIKEILNREESGIFHFSGEEDINYFQFAQELNKELINKNKKTLRIISSTSYEKGIKVEDIGKITKLNMNYTTERIKVRPISIKYVCKYLVDYF